MATKTKAEDTKKPTFEELEDEIARQDQEIAQLMSSLDELGDACAVVPASFFEELEEIGEPAAACAPSHVVFGLRG